MNAVAKVITCTRKFDHVTPLLTELHWLPLCHRIVLKILLYTFKALHGVSPTYLTKLITPYVPRRALKATDQLLLEQATHKPKPRVVKGVLIPFPRKLFFSNPSSNPTTPACVAQIEIPFPFFYGFFFHESQSQCKKSHFPASKKGKSQLPFYPFTTL